MHHCGKVMNVNQICFPGPGWSSAHDSSSRVPLPLLQGLYSAVSEIFQHLKEQFPPHTQHAKVLSLSHIVLFTAECLQGSWHQCTDTKNENIDEVAQEVKITDIISCLKMILTDFRVMLVLKKCCYFGLFVCFF